MRLWVKNSDQTGFKFSEHQKTHRAFTLIELLVVVAVISLLLAILVPALSSARKKAVALCGMVNQRNTVTSLNVFANDNNDRYPFSVATSGMHIDTVRGLDWSWDDPRRMVGYKPNLPYPIPNLNRSISAYLSSYIPEPDVLHCPSSPNKYPYLDQVWKQGDQWDNPDLPQVDEPMTGSYCFWWNYKGWLPDSNRVFKGPMRSSGGVGQSKMVISDYFGSDTWRNRSQFGSCEVFNKSGITSSSNILTDFWTGGDISQSPPIIKLRASFTDGHCQTYDSSEVVTLQVSKDRNGTDPYDRNIGKGEFYLPIIALP
ncbi:MAG: type II secretion system protein [Planctomycetes bacterium]|nr:type II secretion system protein [Planctomycetota bacterium]